MYPEPVTILPFHPSRGKPPTQLIAILDALGVPYDRWTAIEREDHYQIILLLPKSSAPLPMGSALPIQPENAPAAPATSDAKNTARLTRCDLEILRLIGERKHRMTTRRVIAYALQVSCRYSDASIRKSLLKLTRLGKLTNRRDLDPPGYGLDTWLDTREEKAATKK